MKKTIAFTQEGHADLLKKKQKLLEERPSAVAELKRAREMGDLSENGAYKGARFKLSQIDRDLRFVENLLKIAYISEAKSTDVVDIGTTVVLSTGNQTITYAIVGGFESNPLEGKISHVSPIGKSLLGKKAGESVTLVVPKGKVTYTILEIK
ncbi:MAG TPA: GreA/GreB family elongation factor [Patescibacteria group bacterium]